RRRRRLAAGEKALNREFEISAEAEEQIIIPILHACEDELWEFVNETSPEGLAGVAIKLRSLRQDEMDPEESSPGAELGQCIVVIERRSRRGANARKRANDQ